MPRDTYHDYVTAQELCDCRSLEAAQALVSGRRDELAARSGARNVTNAVLRATETIYGDAHLMAVSFDSRAWTG